VFASDALSRLRSGGLSALATARQCDEVVNSEDRGEPSAIGAQPVTKAVTRGVVSAACDARPPVAGAANVSRMPGGCARIRKRTASAITAGERDSATAPRASEVREFRRYVRVVSRHAAQRNPPGGRRGVESCLADNRIEDADGMTACPTAGPPALRVRPLQRCAVSTNPLRGDRVDGRARARTLGGPGSDGNHIARVTPLGVDAESEVE